MRQSLDLFASAKVARGTLWRNRIAYNLLPLAAGVTSISRKDSRHVN